MEIPEILSKVRSYGCDLVEVTGGEPLVQKNVHGLLRALCDAGLEVLLETGGSIGIETVDPRVKRIVDFKCPGSGMEQHNLWSNVEFLTARDEVKFVVGSREDFEWAVEKIHEMKLLTRCSVLLSPVFGVLQPARLAEWLLQERLPVRMQLQMHKHIWEPEARGV